MPQDRLDPHAEPVDRRTDGARVPEDRERRRERRRVFGLWIVATAGVLAVLVGLSMYALYTRELAWMTGPLMVGTEIVLLLTALIFLIRYIRKGDRQDPRRP